VEDDEPLVRVGRIGGDHRRQAVGPGFVADGVDTGQRGDQQERLAVGTENSPEVGQKRDDDGPAGLATRQCCLHPVVPLAVRRGRQVWRVEHHRVERALAEGIEQVAPHRGETGSSGRPAGVRADVARDDVGAGLVGDARPDVAGARPEVQDALVGLEVPGGSVREESRVRRGLVDGVDVPEVSEPGSAVVSHRGRPPATPAG
jgi:hypothetical protein